MLRSILYLFKIFLFWLIFFTLHRLCFMLAYTEKIPDGKFSEALLAFYYSFKLDVSAISYLLAIPLLLWAIQQFLKKNIFNHINHYYHLVLIPLASLVGISNIALYGEWEALINYHTISYIARPALIFPHLSTLQLLAVLAGVAAVMAVFVLLFRIMLLMIIPYSTSKMLYKVIIVPLFFPFCFLLMRGGIQSAPINETSACFSEIQFINHISINPLWHLGHTALLAWEEKEK